MAGTSAEGLWFHSLLGSCTIPRVPFFSADRYLGKGDIRASKVNMEEA